ncbi:MAG: DUF2341 domain-containing protein [bacterium]
MFKKVLLSLAILVFMIAPASAKMKYWSSGKITITAGTSSTVKSDLGDFRVTGTDGTTLLSYWHEDITVPGTSPTWIKFSSVPTGTMQIGYVYYTNSDATSIANGNNVFIFFDDFSGTFTNWTVVNSNYATITSGELRYTGNDSDWYLRIYSNNAISRPNIIEWKSRNSQSSASADAEGYTTSDSANGYSQGIMVVYGQGSGLEATMRLRLDGTEWTEIDSLDQIISRTQKLILPPSSGYKFYKDNVLYEDDTAWTNPNNANRISFSQYWSSKYSYVDDIRVRKYASSEPTLSLGAEESSSALSGWSYRRPINCTNNSGEILTDYQAILYLRTSSAGITIIQ